MSAHVPTLPLGTDPLIAEAKERARRRRLIALAAAGLLAIALLAVELAPSGAGGGVHGTIPWVPTKPSLGAANPPLAPPCAASQLGATLSLQGATMSYAGPISLVNRSSRPCSLLGRPKLSFAGATSKWKETRYAVGPTMPFDPLAPPRGSLRALRPGEYVSVQLFWSNWCGRGAAPGGYSTQPPAAIVFAPPGGGRIRLSRNLHERSLPSPVCNPGPGGTSTLAAANFAPYVPQGPPSSALPLSVRIATGAQIVVKGRTVTEPGFVARAGAWHSFSVVLTNRSRRAFSFGRRCPAYTEGFLRETAYVLNCHGVGSIAPGAHVRFAMRIFVPRNVGAQTTFDWTLAPHSWNAPFALGSVEIR